MDYYIYDYEDALDENDQLLFEFSDNNFGDLWHNCVGPSIWQVSQYIAQIIFWNIICRSTWTLVNWTGISFLKHLVSFMSGVCLLLYTVGSSTCILLCFGTFDLLLLLIAKNILKFRRIGLTFTIICLVCVAIGELQTSGKLWHQLRGTQMISTMKAISVAFDVDNGKINRLPTILQFMGYLFCPGNCLLGPWLPYEEYILAINRPAFKVKWIYWTILNVTVAVSFLILSNCIIPMLTPDFSWKWLLAYRDALAFRCSHYFISFLSQATMSASGMITQVDSSVFGLLVTKPWSIEIPVSLVQVVVNWNIPMHRWLKTYVFKTTKPYGTAIAIFMTYITSSLLHGLNFQLYAVLLSLGLYTFIEYSVRHKIATIFSACVSSTICKSSCSHESKWSHPVVLIINIVFSCLTIIHLAYLGVMFEGSTTMQEEGFSLKHTFSKWQNLDFVSHWIIIFLYVFYFLI